MAGAGLSFRFLVAGPRDDTKLQFIDMFARSVNSSVDRRVISTTVSVHTIKVRSSSGPSYEANFIIINGGDPFDVRYETDAVLLCFNPTSRRSLQCIQSEWFPDVRQSYPKKPYLIVGLRWFDCEQTPIMGPVQVARERGTMDLPWELNNPPASFPYSECDIRVQEQVLVTVNRAISLAMHSR
ncbi:hypothetical protein BDN72DRAFT_555174 [Pluteus cervinus]|uniref:Uncharacterized protein n=1 Tax=Pluteus cervinus TaxID=181527 RepID=A0ACD3A2R7_9AGAR|nr:hypothetical protein BDN72DRAFT_555174 [Pluteus cervinus]